MSAGGYGSLLSLEDINRHDSTMILVCRSGLAGSANAPAADQALGDGSAGSAKSCDRLTRSRCAV